MKEIKIRTIKIQENNARSSRTVTNLRSLLSIGRAAVERHRENEHIPGTKNTTINENEQKENAGAESAEEKTKPPDSLLVER